MKWTEAKKLREERTKTLADMQSLLDTANKDGGRDLNDDENTKFDEFRSRAETIGKQLERYDQIIALAASQGDDPQQRSQAPGREDIGPENTLGVPEKDLRSYSVLKVIRSQVENRPLDGIERELSDEIAQRCRKQPEGVFVPHEVSLETRDLTTTTGSGAVATNTATTFIELLRSRLLVSQLGARYLGGLVGDLSIPKQTGGASAYWVTEGNSPTKGEQTVGQVGLAPSTVGAFSDMSRKFVKQSSIDAEAFVRADLAAVIARALDTAVFNGSGSGAEPEGILQNSDVPTVAIGTNGGAATFAKMVELETTVASDDADMGSLHYVTNAKVRGSLKTTVKESGQASYVWSEQNSVNGYSAHATNLIPGDLTKGSGTALSAAIFGNWNDVVMGMWGGLDILVDPYTGSTAGTVRVVALQDVDIALRHAESFAKLVDITTA